MVKSAVLEGKILGERYKNYLSFLSMTENCKKY